MQQKRLNKYTTIIVVLAVLLALSLMLGVTFAWFASTDEKDKNYYMGDAITLKIAKNNAGDVLADGEDLPFVVDGNYLLPGMKINTFAGVKFAKSNNPALLRVKLTVSVTDGEGGTATEADKLSLQNDLNNKINEIIIKTRWVQKDGWFYYLSDSGLNEVVENSMLEKIECSDEEGALIKFLDPYNPDNPQKISIPSTIKNNMSKCKVTFTFSAQAVQAYIPNITDPNDINSMPTTIANAQTLFNECFAVS